MSGDGTAGTDEGRPRILQTKVGIYCGDRGKIVLELQIEKLGEELR